MFLILTSVEKILNSYLHLDPETEKRLALLSGKVVQLQFQPLGYQMVWLFKPDGIHLQDQYAGPVDVYLQGSFFDFMRFSASSATSANVFGSDIKILGDLDVAQQFKELFAHCEIDWEEKLTPFTGDVVAHQTGNLFRSLNAWAKQSMASVQEDLSEYVHEEKRWFPPREELQNFYNEIDKLRNDVDRMTLRVERLQKKIDVNKDIS